MVELSTPRDREGSFEPQIVKKRQSSLGNFGEKIVSLYARGMSTREIEDHLKELYGVEVSPLSIAPWERNWERLAVFYKYPVEIRKIVYTTNAIESLQAQIRRNTRNRKIFPNNEALITGGEASLQRRAVFTAFVQSPIVF